MRRGALFVVALALGLALGDGSVRAQSLPRAVLGLPAEQEALELYRANELISARTKAEALLVDNPDSAIGHYVLGCVLREAEGSLPRAMAHLGKARGALEEAYGPQPPEGPLTDLHREILFSTIGLAGELEEYAFQAGLLDYYDALYDPDLPAERAWLELKRGRFEVARSWATRAIAAGNEWQRSLGKNALCAIESEAGQRQRASRTCLDALANARARAASVEDAGKADPTGRGIAVHAFNAALAARGALAPDEAERLAREGTRQRELTIANPWLLLSRSFVDEGRLVEALGAAREMQEWRVRLPAYLREQGAAESDATLALLMLVLGEPEGAMELAGRALERPDRRGLTSSRPEQALAGGALLRRAASRAVAERARERASARGLLAGARELLGSTLLFQLADEQRIRSVLTSDERLIATFRLYLAGGIDPGPSWLVGDLIQVLSPGVVKVVLDRVRREELDFPAVHPLYDALEAEVELARGRNQRALLLAERALAKLPKGEALLAARTAAVGAEAARSRGDATQALALYRRAFEGDPGVIRRLGLSLPAVITARGGREAELARDLLRSSPRLKSGEGGLEIRIERRAADTRVCMLSPDGSNLSCVEVPHRVDEDANEHAVRVADAFHGGIFAARTGLSAADLDSLDGSNSLASQAQRQRLQEVLRQLEGAAP